MVVMVANDDELLEQRIEKKGEIERTREKKKGMR